MIKSTLNFAYRFVSPSFLRYGIMAVVVVGIELASFWIMYEIFGVHYLAATILSLAVGIILNWLGSRYFVFGNSRHSAHKEFSLVAITSLFGVGLQTTTVFLMVEAAHQAPILGKIIAIVVTFFWNYFVRKRYIYKA